MPQMMLSESESWLKPCNERVMVQQSCFSRDNLWWWQEQVKSCKFKRAKEKINGCISEAYAYSRRKQLKLFNTTDFLAKWQLKNKCRSSIPMIIMSLQYLDLGSDTTNWLDLKIILLQKHVLQPHTWMIVACTLATLWPRHAPLNKNML